MRIICIYYKEIAIYNQWKSWSALTLFENKIEIKWEFILLAKETNWNISSRIKPVDLNGSLSKGSKMSS